MRKEYKYTEKQLKRILMIEGKKMRDHSFKRSCKTADLNPEDFSKVLSGKEKNSQNLLFVYKLKKRKKFEEELKRIEKKPVKFKRTVYDVNFIIKIGIEITLNTYVIKRISDSEYICNGEIMKKNKIIKLVNK
ncbi:MAG: hypothetical protein ACRC5F_08145 [Cetobacterium sp.]